MSTSVYLVCGEHSERIQVAYHRARAKPCDDAERVAQFCYRHLGCNLTAYNEHSGEPWDATDMPEQNPDQFCEVPHAGVVAR